MSSSPPLACPGLGVTAVTGEWCSSHGVSIRTGAGPESASDRDPEPSASGRSSPTRPAITEGVVTSRGVFGSTVAK